MTELPDNATMDLIEFIDALIAAPDEKARAEVFAKRKAETAHLPKERPVIPTFNWGPRKSLTELRPRHLLMVEEYGFRRDYDRAALHKYFLDNWHRLFGPLRKSKALEVPSDQLRKELMLAQLLALIEGRRAEYSEERSHHKH